MGKQTRGKDDSGDFHPHKGMPSGANKKEGLALQETPPDKLDQYNDLTESIQKARMN